MSSLTEIFKNLDKTKEGTSVKFQHFLDVYDLKFKMYKDRPIKLLEIGVEHGGSLSMWHKYFTHKDTKIYGLDINKDCLKHTRDNIEVIIGDQVLDETLDTLVDLGPFDIIIDDGGHRTNQHTTTYNRLFKDALNIGGLYILEDLHTCYISNYIDEDCDNIIHNTINDIDDVVGGGSPINSIEYYNALLVLTKGKSEKIIIRSGN